MSEVLDKGKAAKAASYSLAVAGTTIKNNALTAIAKALVEQTEYILSENSKDVLKAKENGIKDVMVDRLTLTEKRISDMAQGVMQVVSLEDPIGTVDGMWVRPNGLKIGKTRVPLGVIAIIFESRPNVTVDAASLCLKSGNAVILRGGKEAINSNIALANIMREAIKTAGLSKDCIALLEDTGRENAVALMKLNQYVNVLIPRGGAGLIKTTVENATVPVIETGTGNCHIFVDSSADFTMALDILYNAKTSRPSVCNAAESLVVCEDIAEAFLPLAQKKLSEKSVEIRGCEKTQKILKDCTPATEEDFYTEYLDYIISCKIVKDIDEAINHINTYSTGHSEAIITKSYENAEKFQKCIDSAAVYVNASTRFTDGFEFGLGAEIGISTQKMHARGPMGLMALTSIKYLIMGNGQIC